MILHTAAGDRWREKLRRPDGTFARRVSSIQEEQDFWRKRMEAAAVSRDGYAETVWETLCRITAPLGISSVLEIGPGWGNYTFSLCRSFDETACVDISPDNLRFLKEEAKRQGLRLQTYCSAWETAELGGSATGGWDLVFGYNCLYRLLEPELFLRKMNDTARKLCVIGMNHPPELPWLTALEEKGLPLHYTRQGCAELAKVLSSLGIQGEIVNIPNFRTYRYPDREAVLNRAEQFLLAPYPREELWELLAPWHYEEKGEWICDYPFDSQLLVWEPVK